MMELEKHTAKLYALGYRQMPIDMQEMVLTGINKNTKNKNPSPFTTITPKDPRDAEYVTLSGGVFQEIFETKTEEIFGNFVYNTATKKITQLNTSLTTQNTQLIDPVAFAYDFGARIYDARLGRWLSLDPLMKKYASLSPYNFVANSPIMFIDPVGKSIRPVNEAALKLLGALLKTYGIDETNRDKIFNSYPDRLGSIKSDDANDPDDPNSKNVLSKKDFINRAKKNGLELDDDQKENLFKIYETISSNDETQIEVLFASTASALNEGEEGSTMSKDEPEGVISNKGFSDLKYDIGKAGVVTPEIMKNAMKIGSIYKPDRTGDDYAVYENKTPTDDNRLVKKTIIINGTGKTNEQIQNVIQNAINDENKK